MNLLKKVICSLLLGTVILFSGCQRVAQPKYQKFSNTFFDTFNTVTIVMAYTEDEATFQRYFEQIHNRFLELHQLYDIYNNYEGINNIKTINDQAGIAPVQVDQEIIDLLTFAKDWYQKSGGTNIALGAVLEIWHEYRTIGIEEPEKAEIPPLQLLQEAANHTNMDDLIIDQENKTVFLADPKLRLDVGAVAKGFATELVAKELQEAGFTSGVINAGGNIRVIGNPLDDERERWGVGLQNPRTSIVSEEKNLDVIFVKDAAVVSSGDYQRYYYVGEERLHHIIDTKTLMPANYYQAVTVVTQDSGSADFLSTSLFVIPYEESRKLAESLENVEVLWVMADGQVQATPGMEAMMKSHGATDQK